jgi:hypothetical protein
MSRTELPLRLMQAVGGIVGALLTGVFAVEQYGGTAGLIEGNAAQVVNQLIGIAIVMVYDAAVSFIILKIIDVALGLRVDEDDERDGLDPIPCALGPYPKMAPCGVAARVAPAFSSVAPVPDVAAWGVIHLKSLRIVLRHCDMSQRVPMSQSPNVRSCELID